MENTKPSLKKGTVALVFVLLMLGTAIGTVLGDLTAQHSNLKTQTRDVYGNYYYLGDSLTNVTGSFLGDFGTYDLDTTGDANVANVVATGDVNATDVFTTNVVATGDVNATSLYVKDERITGTLPYDYIVNVTSGTYYSKNCRNGEITSNANYATLFNAILANGGSFYVKDGAYALTTSLLVVENYTSITFSKGAIISLANNANCDMISINAGGAAMMEHITIQGGHLEGNYLNVASGDGVYGYRLAYSTIENMEIYNTDDCGIFITTDQDEDMTRNRITNNLIWGTQDWGVKLSATNVGVNSAANANIISNNFFCFTTGGISLIRSSVNEIVNNWFGSIASTYGIQDQGTGNKIANNHFEYTAATSIFIDGVAGGNQALVTGNTIISPTTRAIHTTQARTTITGNSIKDTTTHSIYIESSYCIVTNNNNIYSPGSHAIFILGARTNEIVSGNNIHSSALTGIYCEASNSTIIGNLFRNCTRGIQLASNDYNTIIGNRVTDTSTATFTVAGTNNIIRDNSGYITENSGTATIASGGTSIVVNHGCSFTPSAKDLSVIATNATSGALLVYADTFTATQFTLHSTAAPGANAPFSWHIAKTP